VITSASIAALVRGRVGAELERRRVRLRQALHAERDPLSPLRASGAPPERLDLPGETMAPAPVSTSVLLPPDRRPRTPAASAAMLVASALILVGGWVAYSRVASGPAPARPLVLSPAPIPPAAWNTPTRSSVASAPAAPPSDNGWVAADSSPPEAALVEAAPLVTVKSTSAKEPAPVPAAQRVASPPLPAGPKASGLRSRPGDGRADEIPANPY